MKITRLLIEVLVLAFLHAIWRMAGLVVLTLNVLIIASEIAVYPYGTFAKIGTSLGFYSTFAIMSFMVVTSTLVLTRIQRRSIPDWGTRKNAA